MNHFSTSSTPAVLFCMIAGALLSLSAAAEEGSVQAFSSWQAKGQMYPTAPEEMTFVGSFFGILYVQGEDGSFDAGLITCPSTVAVNTRDRSLTGNGKCVIVTPDAERVYAAFECSGAYREGCSGNFTLTGGTGSKSKISGGGEVQFKSAFANLTLLPGNVVEQEAVGMAYWPKLTFSVPDGQ